MLHTRNSEFLATESQKVPQATLRSYSSSHPFVSSPLFCFRPTRTNFSRHVSFLTEINSLSYLHLLYAIFSSLHPLKPFLRHLPEEDFTTFNMSTPGAPRADGIPGLSASEMKLIALGVCFTTAPGKVCIASTLPSLDHNRPPLFDIYCWSTHPIVTLRT
jgi:hypothetical protein